MPSKPTLPRRGRASIVVVSALATVVSLGMLGGVIHAFRADGTPMMNVVVAERICNAEYAYASERAQCVREQLETTQNSARRTPLIARARG